MQEAGGGSARERLAPKRTRAVRFRTFGSRGNRCLAAGAVAVGIAGLTVSLHVLLVARAQPVTALRYE